MANSTTNLDLVSASQASKEVTVNALLDAASPAMLYGRRAVTTAGLTWGFYGGTASAGGVPTAIANGTVTLTASATNYVQAHPTTGAVSVNTAGFTSGHKQLYSIVTGAGTVTSYTDLRTLGGGDAGGVTSINGQDGDVTLDAADVGADAAGTAAAAVSAHAAAGDPHPQYLTSAEGAASAASAVSAHEALGDPHPQYLTQTEGDARYLQAVGAQPFDLTAFYPGVPTASAIVTRVPVARAVTFPSGLTGSIGKASIAATAQTDFDVQKNGTSVGTVRFAPAATSATFIAASAITLAAGDLLSIHAPAVADTTLANVGIVLAGTR